MSGHVPHPPTVPRELAALARLRWRMLRRRSARTVLLVASSVIVLGLAVALVASAAAPAGADRATATVLVILAVLAFPVVTMITAASAAGGQELLPRAQAVAFPLHAQTIFASTVLLAPLTLVWTLQVLFLLLGTAYVARQGVAGAATVALMGCYVATASVLAYTAAWTWVGIRQTRRGRRITTALGLAVVVPAVLAWRSGTVAAVVNLVLAPPIAAVLAFPSWYQTALTAVVVVLTGGAAYALGTRVCTWALSRPDEGSERREARSVRRGRWSASEPRPPATPFTALLRVDHRSVWRSGPLRRGFETLGVAPGASAWLAQMQWSEIILLPGLVAAGAGLLFGVNAFCLDGSGAAWLETAPRPPRAAVLSKALVVVEICLLSAAVAVGLAGAGSGQLPTAGEAVSTIGALIASAMVVTAVALRQSVLRPHRADLRSARDTPAPPVVMAVHALRLTAVATLLCVLLGVAVQVGGAPTAVAAAVAAVALAAWHLVRTGARWADPDVRRQVVVRVASG
jgi:hypothetical protein